MGSSSEEQNWLNQNQACPSRARVSVRYYMIIWFSDCC